MADVTWTFKGRLLLDPQLPEVANLALVSTVNYDKTVPLAGVRVEVSGKQFDWDPTAWEVWDEAVTDDEGYFTLSHQKNSTRRFIRLRVMFKDDSLKIYGPNDSLAKWLIEAATDLVPGVPFTQLSIDAKEDVLEQMLEQTSRIFYDVKWLKVRDTGVKQGPGTWDFGNIVFGQGANQDLGDFTARRHAEIWYIAKKAMAFVNALGGVDFRADRPLAFLHPHDNAALPQDVQSSYSSPHNDICYIVRNGRIDDFDTGTILHEMMHLWGYQHSFQEERLATYLLAHFDTHTGRHKPWVVCHEAMAEALANEIERQVFRARGTVYGGEEAQRRPLSRPYLTRQGMRRAVNLDYFEDGWRSVFGLLLCPDIADLDMSVDGPYAQDLSPGSRVSRPFLDAPVVTLAELMRVIATAGRASNGRDGGWRRDAMRIGVLLASCVSDLPQLTPEHHEAFEAILDPAETRQPWELLPSSLKAQPVDPGVITSGASRSFP